MSYKKKYSKIFPLEYGKNNKTLRTICSPIKNITPKIKELTKALSSLLREYEGVGLAAPQIGQTVRIIAVTQRNTKEKERKLLKEIIMINPVLLGHSNETNIGEEGCLSLPKTTGKVERFSSISVKFQSIDGKNNIIKAEGYNARIILHEIDHLNGILFTDKVI